MRPQSFARVQGLAVVEGEKLQGAETTTVYVARLPHGPLLVLEGTAALVWHVLDAPGARPMGPRSSATDAIVVRVAELVERSTDEIREDVEAFLARLVALGILSEVGGCGPLGANEELVDRRASESLLGSDG